jgi:hypothetical protein
MEVSGGPTLVALVVQKHEAVERTRPLAVASWNRGAILELSQGFSPWVHALGGL